MQSQIDSKRQTCRDKGDVNEKQTHIGSTHTQSISQTRQYIESVFFKKIFEFVIKSP